MGLAPRIYSFSTLHGAPVPDGDRHELAAVAAMGFDTVHGLPAHAAADARACGLRFLADVSADPFSPEREREVYAAIDDVCRDGAAGVRVREVHALAAATWAGLLTSLRAAHPGVWFCADPLGRNLDELRTLESAGFDYVMSSVGWWNGRDPWFLDQQPVARAAGRSIGFPVTAPGATPEQRWFDYQKAVLLSAGVMLHRGTEAGITREITELNRLKATLAALNEASDLRRFAVPGSPVTGLVRIPATAHPLVFAMNFSDETVPCRLDDALNVLPPEVIDLKALALPLKTEPPFVPAFDCAPLEVRLFAAVLAGSTRETDPPPPAADRPPSRVVIERIAPELDGGQFPVKRVTGDVLEVTADIFRDGHDKIAACLRLRQAGEADWRVTPFRPVENDRWSARLPLTRVGRATFVIEAWTDRFASWCDEVRKKRSAGQGVELELDEGKALVAAAAARSTGALQFHLQDSVRRLDTADLPADERCEVLLSPILALWMRQASDRGDAAFSAPRAVTVDRLRARFSSWYEMFPRSQGRDPSRSATFADCVARFPEVRAMGFDVVYFVPIHPIGERGRKGRNNGLRAGASDPGSPYAIGSRLGGHTAIDPALGSLEDFRRLVRAAEDHGLEIALDFAVQCAPDHPWVTAHPGWFRRRPDGSIRFAENPPKQYEDIVNVDFDQADWRGLWAQLRDVVKFWVNEGVKIFRVDNPHTKPFAFWRWLIEEVQAEHPDVIFLAEAFTRPKIMRRLAKEGFGQSYTYFTWRNAKAELIEYLTELTGGESAECLRPNFFPSTPDILPLFLQQGGRAAFRIRLVLAATLSSNYGLYNGYELCENEALPGREEYEDSEKYEFKVRDWNRPGHIKDDIRQLNALRAASAALQRCDNLRFHPSSHPAVLFYSKRARDGHDWIFVAVTLDPHQPVQADLEFPLPAPGRGTFVTEELFSGWRQEWSGSRHTITLNPAAQPALVWKVIP